MNERIDVRSITEKWTNEWINYCGGKREKEWMREQVCD